MSTPSRAPSSRSVQRSTTSEDDEYDKYFEDDKLIHVQSEATAPDGDEGQGGTDRSANNENDRHHQATQTPHSRVAVEATRSIESAPVLRTSASATSGSTRRRSGTIATSSTGAPYNVQPTPVVSGDSLALDARTQPSDSTAQRGSATSHATSPTTSRRSTSAHQTPTTPSRRTTTTQSTSPTPNPRLSRAEVIANAIRASRANQTTPPPSGQGQGVTHSNNSNQSPSAPFGVVSWPAHPDMSFSLAVNRHNGGGGVMAPTSGPVTPMTSPVKASSSSSSSSSPSPTKQPRRKSSIVPRGSLGNPRDFTRSNYNFYAVARGRITGIFLTWEEADAHSIRGHPDPLFQGFMELDDAEAYLARHLPRR